MNKQKFLELENAKFVSGNDVCEVYYRFLGKDANNEDLYRLMVFPKGKTFKYQCFFKTGSFEEMKNHADELANKEIERKNFEKSRLVKVGDIMTSVWGHEQTNVCYYQVVALKGKSSVILREIEKSRTPKEGTWCCEMVTPIKDKFVGSEFYVRVKGDSCKINEYETAKLEAPSGNVYKSREITTYA